MSLIPLDCDLDVRVMTFRRPWAEAIARPPPPGSTAPTAKRVDNRPGPPPSAHIGRRIALHVGRGFDAKGLDWINRTYGYGWTEADLSPPGRILGVVRIVGVVESGEQDVPWFFGHRVGGKRNVGWRLGALHVLPGEFDYGDGMLGLWRLQSDLHARLMAELREAESFRR